MAPLRSMRPYRVTGLTIVELLVVLGVLGVLAGIFLTGVFAVRRRVDAVHCVSHLHQLGLAVAMYAEDHKALPLVAHGRHDPTVGRPPSPRWSHDIAVALRDYVTDADIIRCPPTRGHLPWVNHRFNTAGSGLHLSQIRTLPSRALIMFCPFDRLSGYGHGKPNALFLDGHVKAYDSLVVWQKLWLKKDGSHQMMWPPD